MADIKKFDPDGVDRAHTDIFDLPWTPDESQLVLIPAPWGVTVSYGQGTHEGPRAIYDASSQIDYDHPTYGADSWKIGLSMLPLREMSQVYKEGKALRARAEKSINALEQGKKSKPADLKRINDACERFHSLIENTSSALLRKGKLVGVIGGDHSTSLGLIRALSGTHEFGILQIDAHCDLYDSFEGFGHGHASIMRRALELPAVKKLVQVGIRQYAAQEREFIESHDRIRTFFDFDMKKRVFEGGTWRDIVADIVTALPQSVYISFDIDGLDPSLCPNTGTPVPGGLQYQEAMYLLQAITESGKTIVGFDLCEVSPGKDSEWDANVGMRVLWNLAMWAAKSNKLKLLTA